MTEDLRNKVLGIYHDLKTVVEKDPSTKVGNPTLQILRKLITDAKDSGGDAKLCDAMLEAIRLSASATISASDAFAVAGQLMKITQ